MGKLILERRTMIAIAISGLVALIVVNVVLKQRDQSSDVQYVKVPVLVSAQDIAPQTRLTAAQLTVREIPIKFMEPGAVLSSQQKNVEGKVIGLGVPAGTQLLDSMLKSPSVEETGVAPLLPAGKVGYVLRLGNLDVSGKIEPNNHIDVLATLNFGEAQNSIRATYSILQNILIVAVGNKLRQSTSENNGSGLELSLALAPEEAQRLALIQTEAQGEITVIVRSPGDDYIHPSEPVTSANLFGNRPAPPPAARVPK